MGAHNIQTYTRVVFATLAFAVITGCTGETDANSNRKTKHQVEELKTEMEKKGPDGQPIIFWRITQENREAISALLDLGYDIETKGGFGVTPVIDAALIDDWITVLLLLERGANPLAASRNGLTLTNLLSTSRVDRKGRYGVALEQVQALLKNKGINDTAYTPVEVKKMLADGEWPPAR